MNIQTTTLRGTLGVLALGSAFLRGITTFAGRELEGVGGELTRITYKAVCRATLPANAVWNTPEGTGDFALVKQEETSHNVREPDAGIATYSGAYDPTQCTFSCAGEYVWDGSSCDIPRAECETENITIGAYTIASCNVGAEEAGTGSASYGNYFQRGNNYGFSNTGSISTDSTPVDTTGYGPGNPYTSGTFIIGSDWSSPQNDSLRWGSSSDWPTTIPTGTNASDRRWPCPARYHVPSQWERNQLLIARAGINNVSLNDNDGYKYIQYNLSPVVKFINDLKLPIAGYRGNDSIVYNRGSIVSYRSSSPVSTNVRDMDTILLLSAIYANAIRGRIFGFPVRCFQDSSA